VFEGDNHHALCVSQQREHWPIRADIDVDPQHGPIIRVRVAGRWVSIYLMTQNGVVTEPSGSQYGIEVKGPWHKFEPYMSSAMHCASCIELKAELDRLRYVINGALLELKENDEDSRENAIAVLTTALEGAR
jgi:hypothetical protein